jgi:hypothetical protein
VSVCLTSCFVDFPRSPTILPSSAKYRPRRRLEALCPSSESHIHDPNYAILCSSFCEFFGFGRLFVGGLSGKRRVVGSHACFRCGLTTSRRGASW